MTPADIAALRGLCEAASPGPWKPSVWIETDGDEWRATGPGHDQHAHDYGSEPGGPDEQAAQRDAAFICAARSALPRLLDECEALRRERDAYKALATNAEHWADWADCATNHGGTECDMGPECGLRPETRAELLALTADRDRLRALLREAVDIAREHAAHNNDDKDVRRLAAIAKEGLT